MSTPKGYGDWLTFVIYGVPWAIVLFWVVVVYAVVEKSRNHLTSSELLEVAVAAGVLAIGHGIHHGVHYRRQQETDTDGRTRNHACQHEGD